MAERNLQSVALEFAGRDRDRSDDQQRPRELGDDFVNIDWITVGVVSRISSRLVNELRSQFGRDHEFQISQTPAPGEPLTGPHGKPPETNVAGGITFGKPSALDAQASR